MHTTQLSGFNMIYSFLAGSIVTIHFMFILFVLFGGLLVLKKRFVLLIHIPAIIWGTLVELCNLRCPLTPWENYFRTLSNQSGYSVSFVEHYLIPVIYPSFLTENLQLVAGVTVILVNALIYWRVLHFHKAK